MQVIHCNWAELANQSFYRHELANVETLLPPELHHLHFY